MEKELQDEMKNPNKYLKLKSMVGESFGIKEYMRDKCVEDARTMYRIRTKMINLKMNFKNDPR